MKLTVVIETTIDYAKDIDLDNPRVKSHWYEVEASNSIEAEKIAKELFNKEFPFKGIWDIDVL